MWELVESVLHFKLFWITSFVFAIYFYLKFVTYNYFKKNDIPAEDSIIPFGSLLPMALGQKCIGHLIKESYDRHKKHPFHGLYMLHTPELIINDPDLIRLILVKDFNYFQDRGLHFNKELDPLSAHLFFLPGEEWKHLRSKLSPTFTSGKIKQFFPLMEKIGKDLTRELDICVQKSNTVEIKDLMGRFTTDMISSIAFGLESNSLQNPNTDFRVYGKKSLDTHPVKAIFGFFWSRFLDILRVPFTPKDVTHFFQTVFSDVIDHRRKNNTVRKDFLNLLIQLIDHGEVERDEQTNNSQKKQQSAKIADTISMSAACAQSFVFFIAGFETSSSTTTYCLHELAQNLEIQEKLRKEINSTLGGRNTLTYEDIQGISYLDKVVSETLRKYPILPILNRICLKDYQIPNSNFYIKKGMKIIIPVLGLHNDPNIYPNPEEFRPERFDSDQVAKRNSFAYLPFGEGPRICIGKRFGLLQVKVALIKILTEFKITICEKTEIPLKPTKRNILIMPESDVFLRVERLIK
ncbi:probable cytochrome P450 6a14 [Leptopilina boulardi]|uniref:probable cytochrome P450 6a14 n=1 Tax=Leptopilina boulardi TaxID=63433 RepID=UPI0021F617D7|nr:probable cytochrome P450 6a14 [Leptopilina boulardi]